MAGQKSSHRLSLCPDYTLAAHLFRFPPSPQKVDGADYTLATSSVLLSSFLPPAKKSNTKAREAGEEAAQTALRRLREACIFLTFSVQRL